MGYMTPCFQKQEKTNKHVNISITFTDGNIRSQQRREPPGVGFVDYLKILLSFGFIKTSSLLS